MEVHHHSHHKGKKNWKSYMWEFLMLFLAVFCGFMAEWRLEQTIENHREEVYMESMVEDITADAKQIEKLRTEIKSRISKLDGLLAELATPEVQNNSNKAFQLWLETVGFPDFTQNDRTIQQLKSSGALRIIRNKAVSDKIMEYDQEVRLLYISQNNLNAVGSNHNLVIQLFDFAQLNQKNPNPIPLPETGKRILKEAYANRFFWQKSLNIFDRRLASLGANGKEIAAFIKEEYHID
jgi:hypothetical protein